jgi:hypothetical protein
MESSNQFSVYFNLLKIRYSVYDESLTRADFLTPEDKVNVFINLETALKYLSMVRDLEKKLIVSRNFADEFKVDIVNIAAHYKDFFVGNGLDTKVFIYMTDLTSDIEAFKECSVSEDFRSYYIMKYTQNPKFIMLGDALIRDILPDVRMLCDYIPNVYFISAHNIDGGLIPYIIGNHYPDRKNLIISGDLHDTQYSHEKNFLDHLYSRTYNNSVFCCQTNQFLKVIAKTKDEVDDFYVKLFENPSFYRILLACLGDKYRSIPGLSGIKFVKMARILSEAIGMEKIREDTTNPKLLADLFPEEVREDIYMNLMVTDIKNDHAMITEGDKRTIISQIVDQSDINTLQQLNATRFAKNQLHLEMLLK